MVEGGSGGAPKKSDGFHKQDGPKGQGIIGERVIRNIQALLFRRI